MKWRDLTPEQLRSLAADLFDSAHDDECDREWLIEERGFDVVAATEAVGRFLQREATRRERPKSPPRPRLWRLIPQSELPAWVRPHPWMSLFLWIFEGFGGGDEPLAVEQHCFLTSLPLDYCFTIRHVKGKVPECGARPLDVSPIARLAAEIALAVLANVRHERKAGE